jgi:hypothetical protein
MSEWIDAPMDEGWIDAPMEARGQTLPEAIKSAAEYTTGPMPHNSVLSKEYWTKNVPQSLARLPAAAAYGMGKMAYDAAAQFTDPVMKAISGEQGLGESANQLLHAPTNALTNAATQIGESMAAPLGLLGFTRMSQAWDDPAAAALGVAPIAMGIPKPSMAQVKGVLPFTRENAMKAAGDELRANYGNADLTPVQLMSNRAKTDGLTERTGAEFTPAQQSGSFVARKFEQGRTVPKADSSMSLAGILESREIKGAQSAQGRAMDAMGPLVDQPNRIKPMDELGSQFHNAILEAKAPILERKNILFSEVPENYAGSFNLFHDEIKSLQSQPMTSSQAKALKPVLSKASELLPNGKGRVKDAIVVWEEINDALNDTTSGSAKRTLMQAKTALDASFDEFGAKSKGQIEHQGKLYDIGELDAALEANLKKQQSLSQKTSVLDTKAMVDELAGTPGLMQVWGEKTPAWEARIEKAYVNKTGKQPPRIDNTDTTAQLQGVQSEAANINQILGAAAEPVNAAVKFRIARDYASKEYHERFGGTAKRVTAKGQNSSLGTQLSAENIPRQYDTLQGATDLIREIGDEAAKGLMSDYYLSELQQKFTNKNDIFNPSQALKWATDKGEILKRYGLEETVKQNIKERVPEYLRSQIEGKGVDSKMGDPRLTANQVQALMRDNAKVFSELFGPEELAKWKDYSDVLQTYNKNKNVSYSGGSTTAEKSTGRQVLNAIGDITGGAAIGYLGSGGSTAGGIFGAIAGEGLKVARNARTKNIDGLINESIYNPTLRDQILDNTKKPQAKTSLMKQLSALAATQRQPNKGKQ